MATLSNILGSLESYIHSCLKSMTIDSKGSKKFRKRMGSEISKNPIEDLSGPPRLYQFECENPELVSTVYSGASYTGRIYTFALKILYPDFEGWTQAALSDHSTLTHYVYQNPTSETGIQSCIIAPDYKILKNETNKTFVMQLTIKAFLEITH